jgi:hypothetical protein
VLLAQSRPAAQSQPQLGTVIIIVTTNITMATIITGITTLIIRTTIITIITGTTGISASSQGTEAGNEMFLNLLVVARPRCNASGPFLFTQ